MKKYLVKILYQNQDDICVKYKAKNDKKLIAKVERDYYNLIKENENCYGFDYYRVIFNKVNYLSGGFVSRKTILSHFYTELSVGNVAQIVSQKQEDIYKKIKELENENK